MKIECKLTPESGEIINRNLKYLKNLKEIDLKSNIKIKIGDRRCKAILNNSKY